MHLWPSQKIRKYYSYAYVSKFEWNLKQLRQSKAATLVCASDDRCVIREALISSSSSSPLPSSSEQRKDAIDPFSKIIKLVLLSCCCCCFFFCGGSLLLNNDLWTAMKAFKALKMEQFTETFSKKPRA